MITPGQLLFGIFALVAIIMASVYGMSMYSSKSPHIDTYGNGPDANNTQMRGTVTNVTATGTDVQTAALVMVGVVFCFAAVGYFVYNK